MSLLHRHCYIPGDFCCRMLSGAKNKRSFLSLLLFKRELKNYLLQQFAHDELKLDAEEQTTLRELLHDFAAFDSVDWLEHGVASMSLRAQGLAEFCKNVIYGIQTDPKLLVERPSHWKDVTEWVQSCNALQILAAQSKAAAAIGDQPIALQCSDPTDTSIPHVLSMAFPWLVGDALSQAMKENVIQAHVQKVELLMSKLVRVLDAKVDDATCGPLSVEFVTCLHFSSSLFAV